MIRKNVVVAIVAAMASLCLLSPAAADSTEWAGTLKEYNGAGYTYANVADVWVTLQNGDTKTQQYNFGGAVSLTSYNTTKNPLLKFDLSVIPKVSGVAEVKSAFLRMYRITGSTASLYAGQLSQSWVEGTATGAGGDTCDGAQWITRNAGTILDKSTLVSAGTNLWYFDNVVGVPTDPFTAGRLHIRLAGSNNNNAMNGTAAAITFSNTLADLQALATTTRGVFYDTAACRLYTNKNDQNLRYYTSNDYWSTPGGDIVGSTITQSTAPTAPGWVQWDVTPIVSNWLVNHQDNNGFRITCSTGTHTYASSEATDATLHAELVLDVLYYNLPDPVVDLTPGNPDWYKIDLTWTAPSTNPPGAVATYDIRYSTTAIQDTDPDAQKDAWWAAATPCTGEPAGVTPGQPQTFTVTGLQPDTTYYFACKAIDSAGNASVLSNGSTATGHTHVQDTIPPAAVADLSAGTIKPSHATLSWTASADDGADAASGPARSYDLRCSTSPIDASNFSSATAVTGLSFPKSPGSAETFTLSTLSPLTTYYVAVKAGDEVPNWSDISNVVSFTTPDLDVLPPDPISDLKKSSVLSRTVSLTWTAPADNPNPSGTGTGAYDVRYSTSQIVTDADFAAATQVAGMPAPSAPGTKEKVTVGGLTPDTTYWLAVKTLDQAEPSNTSALSNVLMFRTPLPVPAVTIHNPWIANDRVADCRTLQTIAATFDKAYTPDGVLVADPTDTETRVINSYNNFKRRWYHWGQMPVDHDDTVTEMNIFGWALCGSQAGMNSTILTQMGLHSRTIYVDSGSHTIYECWYNNKWHCLDTMTTYYVYDRGNPRSIASMDDVKHDHNLILNAVTEGRACPGFLLCGDSPTWYAKGSDTWGIKSDPGTFVADKSMNMDVRMGESINRTWESWATQYYNSTSVKPIITPPYHHEAYNDYKDYVNLPYWEPYKLDTAGNAAIGIASTSSSSSCTYRRWANGTVVLQPDFRSAGYQASLLSSTNISTFNDDGLTPDLHPKTTGALANVVYKITTPFYITDLNIGGTFFRKGSTDINRIWVSNTGTGYTKVWENGATGTTQLSALNARTQVFGKYAIWVKVELQASAAITDAGVSDLVITPIFEHNKGGMPYLDKGVNNLTVTFDNPQDLTGNACLKITYNWKEYDGAGWNISRSHVAYVTASPTTFTITTGGTRVPRTESITTAVVTYNPDAIPGPVTDLAATAIGASRISLTWTATAMDGYDKSSGPADSYDLRYSTSPIVDDASFNAATQVADVPASADCGSTETCVITGLTGNTRYYFGIKVLNDPTHVSDLSNAPVSVTTPRPPLPPSWVGDLKGQPSATGGSVDLTWTAPIVWGSDGGGPFASYSYDLRYSTSPILYNDGDATWNAATPVTGLSVPQAPGSTESFTVMGLTGGTRYYFAIKSGNDIGMFSEVSNSAPGRASTLGTKVLQAGSADSGTVTDCCIEAGTPTTNYSGDYMRACGYGAGTNLVQRSLIKFDFSAVVPAGTNVVSAIMALYSYDPASVKGSTGFYGAYPLTSAFDQTSATWNNATASAAWTTPGGDFIDTPDATSPKQAVAEVWYPFDVTARVNSWLAGTSTNNGWMIGCTDENKSNQDKFYTSDTDSADLRPTLTVSDLVPLVVGDINNDKYVNVGDLQALVMAWGTNPSVRGFDPWADINGDGYINVGDLQLLVANWGRSLPN